MGWFGRARDAGYHRWARSTGVRASRTENRSLLHAWIAVAIRRFLTEALKKEEGAAAKKDEERERGWEGGREEGRRKKSGVYRRRNGVSRDRTRGRVVIPDRLIYVYLKAYVCVRIYSCVPVVSIVSLPSAGATVTRDIERKQSHSIPLPSSKSSACDRILREKARDWTKRLYTLKTNGRGRTLKIAGVRPLIFLAHRSEENR